MKVANKGMEGGTVTINANGNCLLGVPSMST
jgi:hypothetical protein